MKSTVDQLSWVEGLYPSNVAGKIAGGTHTHTYTQAILIPRPLPSIARIDQVGGAWTSPLNVCLGPEPGLGNQTRTWE